MKPRIRIQRQKQLAGSMLARQRFFISAILPGWVADIARQSMEMCGGQAEIVGVYKDRQGHWCVELQEDVTERPRQLLEDHVRRVQEMAQEWRANGEGVLAKWLCPWSALVCVEFSGEEEVVVAWIQRLQSAVLRDLVLLGQEIARECALTFAVSEKDKMDRTTAEANWTAWLSAHVPQVWQVEWAEELVLWQDPVGGNTQTLPAQRLRLARAIWPFARAPLPTVCFAVAGLNAAAVEAGLAAAGAAGALDHPAVQGEWCVAEVSMYAEDWRHWHAKGFFLIGQGLHPHAGFRPLPPTAPASLQADYLRLCAEAPVVYDDIARAHGSMLAQAATLFCHTRRVLIAGSQQMWERFARQEPVCESMREVGKGR